MRDEFIKAGFFLPAMGMFIDNHDLDRFASINSSTSAMRCVCVECCFRWGVWNVVHVLYIVRTVQHSQKYIVHSNTLTGMH